MLGVHTQVLTAAGAAVDKVAGVRGWWGAECGGRVRWLRLRLRAEAEAEG